MISWDVKLFVAATPTSYPQFKPTKESETFTSDEVVVLTMDRILEFFFLL